MRFLVLGPLEVVTAGGDGLPIVASKERSILACLIASAGRVVSVDDLVEEPWSEHPPRPAVKTLSSYVSRLGRALQAGSGARSRSALGRRRTGIEPAHGPAQPAGG
jgi:DNA-binding SARP family transcriptional activator